VSRKKPEVKRPQVEVVFCLDTTGSMGGLIDGAKAKIWAIANQIVVARVAVDRVLAGARGDAHDARPAGRGLRTCETARARVSKLKNRRLPREIQGAP
jgi:hypothetical protein